MSDDNPSPPQSGPSIVDVVLVDATPRQRILSWELNGASWAGPLTQEQYVGREQTLSETALSASGGTKYWVLHPKDDPETIVSACEVSSKKLLVADSAANGGCRIVDSYSIASVFTDPRWRGRGLASHMLRELWANFDATTECGALYSDIGRKYYTGLGWADFPSPQAIFKRLEGAEKPFRLPEGVSLLKESDVEALCEKDVAALARKFERLTAESDGKTHITFLPSFVQCAWHFARDSYVARILRNREVEHRGAITVDGTSWLYWDHDLREQKLKIIRIVINESDKREKQVADLKALLLAALAEASDWDLPKLLIWQPEEPVCAAATSIFRERIKDVELAFDERQDGSIPSLRWKGGKHDKEIVWEDNEYFSWC